jgi:protein involved in polysaccharide export with SLBB domain
MKRMFRGFGRSGHFLVAFLLFWSVPARAQDGVGEVARRAAAQLVRPGDHVQLTFMLDRELSGDVTVDERGDAVFPKLGAVNVGRLTIAQVQDTLRARYSEYLRDPDLQVTVLRRVTVNGEVRMPNVYMVDVTSTVRDAIARAGGLLETAKGSKVTIVRGAQRIRVNEWQHEDGPRVDLQSGDQVVVPRKSWLELNSLSVISTSVIVIGLIRSLRH